MGSKIVRLIACAVFKPALEHLTLESRYPNLQVTYLPSNLHLKPQELGSYLMKAIDAAQERDECVVCLYGECFPGISELCRQRGVLKVPGHYCYEMLLGPERFREFIEEIAGTYFVEKDMIENFEEYCMKPLELHDQSMRRYCFEHYRRLLYVRQPHDVECEAKAGEIADFLNLYLDVSDADYSYLERKLMDFLDEECTE